MPNLYESADEFFDAALVFWGETERAEVGEVKLDLSEHVVGAPQPQLLLLAVDPEALRQLLDVGRVILLLELQQGLDVAYLLVSGGRAGTHGS